MTPAEPMGARERVCDNPSCGLHAHFCHHGAHRYVTRTMSEYGRPKDTEHQRHLYVTARHERRYYCDDCKSELHPGIDPDEVRK